MPQSTEITQFIFGQPLRKITDHFLVPCQSADPTPAPRDSSPRIRAFLLTRAKFSPHERSCRRPRGDTQLLRFSAILVSAFYPPGHCYAQARGCCTRRFTDAASIAAVSALLKSSPSTRSPISWTAWPQWGLPTAKPSASFSLLHK